MAGDAAASTLSLCYNSQDGTKEPGCTDYCTFGETANPHGLKEFVFTNNTDVCQTGGWGCTAVNDLCWRDECCNNDCTAAGGCAGATPDNSKCPVVNGITSFCVKNDAAKTCICVPVQCDWTTQTGCEDGYCCIGPDQTSDIALRGTCEGPANSKYSNAWLCAAASPISWHECNETVLGKEITNLNIKYTCSKTDGDYEWVETKTVFGAIRGYVAPAILVLFLGMIFVAKMKNKPRRKNKKWR